jgi:chorismate mutase
MVVKLDNSLIKEWDGYNGRPFLICGPCSAESEEQVMDTAREIAQLTRVRIEMAKERKKRDRFDGRD